MDWLDIRVAGFALSLVVALAGFCGWLWRMIKAQQLSNSKRIGALEERANDVDARLDKQADNQKNLSKRVDEMPGHQALSEVKSELANLTGQVTQANHTLQLINQHLLDKAK